MQTFLWLSGCTLAGYLLGSMPVGYLIARSRGLDIRQHGSGNIGATNVGRVLGPRYGLAVFALDFAKGALPVALVRLLLQGKVPSTPAAGLELAAGLGAFLGHLFPLYLGFRGGKGVATGAGVVGVLLPGPALVALGVWLFVLCASSYVSLASLLATLAMLLSYLLSTPQPLAPERLPLTSFCFAAAALVFWAHRNNLVRLFRGREHRLQESRALTTLRQGIYLLSVSFWFGMLVFFTLVVGPVLFRQWRNLAQEEKRPSWFPQAAPFDRHDFELDGLQEQGTRAAGFCVAQLFPWYYLLQGLCGFLASGACLGQVRVAPTWRSRWRCRLLLLALGLVVLGWAVETHTQAYRIHRDQAIEGFLRSSPDEEPATRLAAREAHNDFGRWHLLSLALNLGTLVSVLLVLLFSAADPTDSTPVVPAVSQTGPTTVSKDVALPAAPALAKHPEQVEEPATERTKQ